MNVLTAAYAEGRITVEEHDERTTAAYTARTLGDLAVLLHDLPNSAEAGLPDLTDGPVAAMLGRRDRTGRWVVPEQFLTSAVGGTLTLDLTDAVFVASSTTITTLCLGGAVKVIAPSTVRVDVEGGRMVMVRRIRGGRGMRGRRADGEPAFRVLLRVRGVGQVTVRTARDRR